MGLIGGMARTAVVAGTATAVSGRVQRRQAAKFADRDAETYAKQDAAYQQQVGPPQPPPAPAAPAADPIAQLKDLAELHSSGVLTDEEFAVQKAKILNG